MQIHTNTITYALLCNAANTLDVFVDAAEHGSRSHARKFTFTLNAVPGSASPPRRRKKNTGNHGASDVYAATWDEWGIVLARLFDIDPDAIVPGVYESGEHFHWTTGGRFRDGGPAGMHDNHRWEYQGDAVTSTYHVNECKCGAVTRRMAYGHNFAELQPESA